MQAQDNVVQMPTSTPPQSVDSEIALLSAVLASPSALDAITAITPDDFYVPVHQKIFEAMLRLRSRQMPPDRFHIVEAVHGKNYEQAVTKAIADLERGEGILYASSVESLSLLIKEKARQRELLAIASTLGRSIMEGSGSEDAIAATIQQLLELRSQEGSATISFADAIAKATDDLVAENAGDEAVELGIQSGFRDLDGIISCFQFGTLSILGGRGGMGKSTFALDIALRVAQSSVNTIFFGLEMTSSQMAKKAIARIAAPHVPTASLFRRNQLNQQHWDKISEVLRDSIDTTMWINDDPRMTVSGIRAEMQKIASQFGYVGFVVIDYVQLLRPEGQKKNGTRTEEIFSILQELRAIAKEFNCAILALSQLRRDIDSRNDKRPTLADFGDSSAFDREAAIALAIYRDEYYDKETTERGIAEILVLKNRFGDTGTAKLLFESRYGEFRDLVRNF